MFVPQSRLRRRKLSRIILTPVVQRPAFDAQIRPASVRRARREWSGQLKKNTRGIPGFLRLFDRRPTAQKINSANYAARISGREPGTAGSRGFHDSAVARVSGSRVYAYAEPLTIWSAGRLRRITVGYPSARVTFRTSHEWSRDIPRGPEHSFL